jgi:hypothetical protein
LNVGSTQERSLKMLDFLSSQGRLTAKTVAGKGTDNASARDPVNRTHDHCQIL